MTFPSASDEPVETVEVKISDGDPVVIQVNGRLLYDSLQPLADALARLDPPASPRVILDLATVPMCDSSALNLLVRTRSDLVAAGGWLRLAAVQPLVETVLRITNLTRILPTYPTAEEAAAPHE